VIAVIYGFKQLAQGGSALSSTVPILFGMVVGAAFVRRQQRLADPLVAPHLFRVPAFNASLATNTFTLFAAFGSMVFIAQYLQLVVGLSPMEAGLWTLPSSGGFVAGSTLAPVLARLVRPPTAIAGSLAVAAAGFVVLAGADGSDLAVVVTGSVVLALGLAPVITLATDIIVGTAPPERAGAASALSETSAELGGALGIAILGSIGTAVYRADMRDAIPAGVPPAAADAARDTLGGALAVGEQLPQGIGATLLETARAAFAHGLRVTAVIGVVVAVSMAVVAARFLRALRGHNPAPVPVEAESTAG
jgi:DHA2 family multidrug resistance protein-like MFS transporter